MEKAKYLDLLAKHGISSAHPGGFNLTKELLNRENLYNHTKLLDVGCGTGETSAYIAKHYKNDVTSIDINTDMLQKAAQRFKRDNLFVKLMNANAMQLPFPSNSFDIVLTESVTIFTEIPKSLSEYSRVLKHEGTLIAVEMTAESPLPEKISKDVKDVYDIDQIPTKDEWCKMLYDAGFSRIQIIKVRMDLL